MMLSERLFEGLFLNRPKVGMVVNFPMVEENEQYKVTKIENEKVWMEKV